MDALTDRYAVRRELGRGGMATVYLADDLRHGRQVAIKVLNPELGTVLGPDRFAREIRVAAGLNHPHILPLYDSGRIPDSEPWGGQLFYVMPYVRGGSLRQRLGRERQLPVDEAVRLVRQIALALDHAHAHGLVHRDVKPENILLHEGEAMVADFGIAYGGEAGSDRLTATGLLLGTPDYMSPEQATGERTLDARSDVYSLACLLYELLTGALPHVGTSPRAVIARRLTEAPPRVRRVRTEVSVAVDEAIAQALAVDPADRFSSAAAFADALAGTLATRPPRLQSVAVLPFANLSPDPENEYFADGIAEDVIAQLSKIRALRVIGRGSVMRFKQREQSLREIGAALDVAALLVGSVRRAGSRVRIVAQLVDAASDRHLWAETYDRELTDIFAIQSDVALQIARALEAELTQEERSRIRKEPTRDLQAYQLFVLGKRCLTRWTQEGVDQGLAYLERAVALDPQYALAFATIAFGYADMAMGVAGAIPADEAFARSKAAASRAIQIDSGLAEAHAVLAYVKMGCDYDWTGAEAGFQRAIELNPNSGEAYDYYGLLLAALERYDEALERQRRAHELDPLTHRGIDLATTFLRAGRYDEAREAVDRVLQADPHFALGHATLGWALLLRGRSEQGVAELEQAVALSPESTIYQAQLGQAYGMTGRVEDAREILRRLERMTDQRYVSPYHIAYVHTGLGDQEGAMDWLERAYRERAGALYGVKGSFLFRSLRGHPRFEALLRRMNLLPSSRSATAP